MVVGPVPMALGAMLSVAGALASAALFRPTSRLDFAISCGVMGTAGVSFAMLVAGIAGLLIPTVVLAMLAVWALAAWIACRMLDRFPPPLRMTADLQLWRQRPWATALLALAGSALAWQVVVGLVLPPYAFDALTYHLTTVFSWVQRGDIAPTSLSLCCAYYPATPELIIALPVLLLGDISLVGIVQVPFVILGAVATAGMARSMGLSRSAALAAGALFAMTPAVLTQASTQYVDVMLAALVMAALHELIRYAATGAAERLVLAGVSTGLVLGFKGVGFIWAFVLFAAAIAAVGIVVRNGRSGATAALKALAAAAGLGGALGGWWYIRNGVMTGNPIYPFVVRISDRILFPGSVDLGKTLTLPVAGADAPWPFAILLSWAADLDFWHQGSYDYQQRLGGLGPVWAWLGIPALTVMTVILFRRRHLGVLPIAAAAIVLLVQPYAWWARFTLPLAALGAIAVAFAATTAPWRWARTVLQASALALASAGAIQSSYVVDAEGRAADLPASEVVALIGQPAKARSLWRLFHAEYAFLEFVPENATIRVDLHARPVRFVSPLFGPRLTRRVVPTQGSSLARDEWIVTSPGRPADNIAQLTHSLAWDRGDVRVWQPRRRADCHRQVTAGGTPMSVSPRTCTSS